MSANSVTATIQLPAEVSVTPADDMLYLGFSRQDLKFHQALGELIDNAISSAPPDARRFAIEIHIERNGDNLDLLVADDGCGISFYELQNKVLQIGGKGSRPGRLNEHGFGLKNALCVLTKNEFKGNEPPFRLMTRDQQTRDQGMYLEVSGPFRSVPAMRIVEGGEADWSDDLKICTGETGTRVRAKSSMHYFRSLFRGRSSFETLNRRLTEHLGVMYRGYLENSKVELLLRWRDVTSGNIPWVDWNIDPIPVPFADSHEKSLEVNYAGNIHKVRYRWGTLDAGQVEDASKGVSYPLKMYYLGNTATQGVDIRVRGRVILPHQITYLWPDREPHGDLNNFVGELIIDDPVFSTVNNKVELDPNNPVWEAVSELLQEKEYAPSETIRNIKRNEAEIQRRLLDKLVNIVPGSETHSGVPTWDAVGVLIDIVHKLSNSDEHIYELKAGTAKPIDVYQLIMYWDARVEAGVRPKLGRLVARDPNERVDHLIKYWNHRKDKGGERYNLEFKRVDELL